MNKINVGFLNPSLGRYKKGLPNTNDLIHLGNNGIKRFKLNINNKIMHKTSKKHQNFNETQNFNSHFFIIIIV